MEEGKATRKKSKGYRKAVFSTVIAIVLGAVLVGLTTQLSPETYLSFLAPQKNRIITAEIGLLGVIAVEMVGKAVLEHFREHDLLDVGLAARAVLRTVGYLVVGVAVVSILAANPALAVGVGSVTGLVIGFSAQNIIGNAFAGMFLAIGRPFRVGDEITVMGNTGRVVEIGVMHTKLDTGERLVLIPSTTIMTQVLQRAKEGPANPHGE